MPVFDNRTDPSAVADVSPNPAVNTTPTPNRVERRSFNRLCLERMKQFTVSLKTNAQRMKQFLHAGS
jgi:hypothetical protein